MVLIPCPTALFLFPSRTHAVQFVHRTVTRYGATLSRTQSAEQGWVHRYHSDQPFQGTHACFENRSCTSTLDSPVQMTGYAKTRFVCCLFCDQLVLLNVGTRQSTFGNKPCYHKNYSGGMLTKPCETKMHLREKRRCKRQMPIESIYQSRVCT